MSNKVTSNKVTRTLLQISDWEKSVPNEFQKDALWNITAYRMSLYISDLGWDDVTQLSKDRRTSRIAEQLYRTLGSISANISEGYSRSTGKAKVLYLEYALGSARESRDWYYKGRFVLDEEVVTHRLDILTQIIRLLLSMIPQQRGKTRIKEEINSYLIG